MLFIRRYLALLAFSSIITALASSKECTGQFVNPITDVCWECMFPITLAGFEVGEGEVPDTENPSSLVCACHSPIRIGVPGSFWEPARLIDVSYEPYCFVNMGGFKMDLGFDREGGAKGKATSSEISRWYVHYYIYPLLYWLELFKDFICFERTSFDVAYISELDPTGMDDDLSLIIHPESFLFNNIVAQAACAADCAAATVGLPIDSLYWCAGCQGSMFPLNGNVGAHIGGVQASLNVAERQVFKMHRMLIADETAATTIENTCRKRKAVIMKKSTYRYQMTNPDPSICQPFGKSTSFFEANKEIPITGEDFGYLIWRKVNCCIL